MPVAAVDEAHGPEATESKVRSSGEFPIMEPESKSPRMQGSSEGQFWFRVLAPDACHHPRAGRLIYYVGHKTSHSDRERRDLTGLSTGTASEINALRVSLWPDIQRKTGISRRRNSVVHLPCGRCPLVGNIRELHTARHLNSTCSIFGACIQVPLPHSARNDQPYTCR